MRPQDRLRGWLMARHDASYDAIRLDLLAMRRAAAPETATPVTDILRERLGTIDADALAARLDPETRALLARAQPPDRARLELALALHADLPGAAERTGLSRAMPPAGVHQMGAGPVATGGSFYHADLVAEAAGLAGGPALEHARILDFGCSSGRVVRVLRAAYPEAVLAGCDPIPGAVDWAARHLPGIAFTRQDTAPPLPYDEASVDLAFAISIWSHFGPAAGPRWLAELHRVVAPGGLLVLTVQGWHTLGFLARQEAWGPAHLGMAARDLVAEGFHYLDSFGPGGDHGVEEPGQWGMAYVTLDRLLRDAPGWSLAHVAEGRNEGNQDVVVLRRAEHRD